MYEPDFYWTINNSEILLKYKNLLRTLSDNSVMCVGYREDGSGYYIIECCDEWYRYDLTKKIALNCLSCLKRLQK